MSQTNGQIKSDVLTLVTSPSSGQTLIDNHIANWDPTTWPNLVGRLSFMRLAFFGPNLMINFGFPYLGPSQNIINGFTMSGKILSTWSTKPDKIRLMKRVNPTLVEFRNLLQKIWPPPSTY